MRFHTISACGLVLALAVAGKAQPPQHTYTLDPSKVIHNIDAKIYGHFLEHIYHSVNGGLWGEQVWNRSFEDLGGQGRWRVDGSELVQSGMGDNVRLPFGDQKWTDYEFTLDAKRAGGNEGFLILFRVRGDKDFYWLNFGGWGNKSHGLERGRADQDRWGLVHPPKPGSIETGRWYSIRVRCEGRKLQAWLDGQPVLDFTDDAKGHASGRVGIGTWSTQARFRNLKVVSLDGKTLFDGLPTAAPGAAKSWRVYGPGMASLTDDAPLNGEMCQLLSADAGETGLAQSALAVRKGRVYAGSLWARGEASEGLVVRLCDGTKVLAEAALGQPSREWKEFPFRLTAAGGTSDATLQIGARGKCRLFLDQVSLMSDDSTATGGFRPDLLRAIAELRPPVIRWPGGCFASAYRWKDGIGPQHKRRAYPLEIWDDRDVNSFGTDEYIAMCRKVGAEPLIVVNIGTPEWLRGGNPAELQQDVLDWIEYCNGSADSKWGKVRAANGHPEPYRVRYWEIDNETWHMGAEAYAEAVRKFAPLMRKVDPSIRLAACGSGGLDEKGIGLAWNRVIVDRCADRIDYLSIHHYEDPNRYADGPRAYEAFFRKTGDMIAKSRNPKLRIYVSEWNAQSTDWRTGLYAGGLLNAFERCGDVLEIGGPALFLRHVSARDWDNAFVNFDQSGWFPAPNYVVMKLWRDHYGPHAVALTGPRRPLNVAATKSADGRTVFVKAVNPEKTPIELTLQVGGRANVARATCRLVAPGDERARNTLKQPHRIAPAAVPAQLNAERDGATVRLSMPPLSAGVITLELR
jgi:alpha-N-arabinofuranosidase